MANRPGGPLARRPLHFLGLLRTLVARTKGPNSGPAKGPNSGPAPLPSLNGGESGRSGRPPVPTRPTALAHSLWNGRCGPLARPRLKWVQIQTLGEAAEESGVLGLSSAQFSAEQCVLQNRLGRPILLPRCSLGGKLAFQCFAPLCLAGCGLLESYCMEPAADGTIFFRENHWENARDQRQLDVPGDEGLGLNNPTAVVGNLGSLLTRPKTLEMTGQVHRLRCEPR